LLTLATGLAVARAQATDDGQAASGPDWTPTSLTSPASRLFTPANGALLAITSDGLMRSDDAGDNWYAINTPGKPVYVDSSNQDVLYATTNTEPLLKSSDGGASWTAILSGPPYAGKLLDSIAVSPADSNLIYAGLKQGPLSDQYWFYRSKDAGSTWTELFHSQNSLCGWGVQILVPHPTDANRMEFSGGCHAGRDFSETLRESTDQGQTFTDVYADRRPGYDSPSGFPKELNGGQGAHPARWWLGVNRDQRFGGSFLLLSDDDARSWNPVLSYVGGGSEDPDKNNFSVTIAAVAYDPNNPDTVYVARNSAFFGFPPTPVSSGVTLSTDGGQTWNDLGNQQTGKIADLALGIDGRHLFLATDAGIARLPLQ
jgi:hypothetical protein